MTGASRFLTGLVTRFATHDGTCEIVPRRADAQSARSLWTRRQGKVSVTGSRVTGGRQVLLLQAA